MGTAESVEVAPAHTEAEVRREAAQMLGGNPGLRLPPLTAGRLALLDVIECPLLSEDRPPTRLEAVRALYVVAVGPAAAAPVARALRQAEAVERAAKAAAQSPELFREYLAALAAAADGWEEFDLAALAWLDGSGIGDLPEAIGALAAAFEDAARGFALVPPGGPASASPFPSPGDSAPNGSATSTPSSAPAAAP